MVAPGSTAPAVASVKSVMSMAALPTPLTLDRADRRQAGIPDGEQGVVTRPTALSITRVAKLAAVMPRRAQIDAVLVAGVPPAASKLLIVSLPKLAAL